MFYNSIIIHSYTTLSLDYTSDPDKNYNESSISPSAADLNSSLNTVAENSHASTQFTTEHIVLSTTEIITKSQANSVADKTESTQREEFVSSPEFTTIANIDSSLTNEAIATEPIQVSSVENVGLENNVNTLVSEVATTTLGETITEESVQNIAFETNPLEISTSSSNEMSSAVASKIETSTQSENEAVTVAIAIANTSSTEKSIELSQQLSLAITTIPNESTEALITTVPSESTIVIETSTVIDASNLPIDVGSISNQTISSDHGLNVTEENPSNNSFENTATVTENASTSIKQENGTGEELQSESLTSLNLNKTEPEASSELISEISNEKVSSPQRVINSTAAGTTTPDVNISSSPSVAIAHDLNVSNETTAPNDPITRTILDNSTMKPDVSISTNTQGTTNTLSGTTQTPIESSTNGRQMEIQTTTENVERKEEAGRSTEIATIEVSSDSTSEGIASESPINYLWTSTLFPNIVENATGTSTESAPIVGSLNSVTEAQNDTETALFNNGDFLHAQNISNPYFDVGFTNSSRNGTTVPVVNMNVKRHIVFQADFTGEMNGAAVCSNC